MKVRAVKEGYFNHERKKPGAVFDIPEGTKIGQWMELVNENEKAAPKKAEEPREPIAMSHATKRLKGKAVAQSQVDDSDMI